MKNEKLEHVVKIKCRGALLDLEKKAVALVEFDKTGNMTLKCPCYHTIRYMGQHQQTASRCVKPSEHYDNSARTTDNEAVTYHSETFQAFFDRPSCPYT